MNIYAKKLTWLICSFLFIYPAIKTYSFPLDLKKCENSNYLLLHPHQVLLCAARVLPTLSAQLNYLGEEKTTQYTQYKYNFT